VSELAEDQNQIAIIGMAGRFPGAPDLETFWEELENGREGITFFSAGELTEAGVSPALLQQANYVKAKGVLKDADLFDASFFGYSPREAELMDPQHRVFLECAWEALESAGCDPQTFDGRIGVFAGTSLNSYLLFNIMANRAAVASMGTLQAQIGNDKDFLTTRVSYKLDLKGPSVTVQTACSTSLTAVHLACQSLLNAECDVAIAGGVSVTVPLKSGYLYEHGGIVSPDGHCRAFDASGGGTVAGNGVGIVVLRRLAEARDNGDAVAAVIRGTALNNDGALKVGYTAPSVEGQAEVIAEALAVAGVDAATIGYVETHGTGTALGDPIEIAALTRAFREHTQDVGFCAIGSVKSNAGHLDAAAGVTALIKTTLALQHEAIPATLNCTRPNPELALETSPFFVNTTLRPWPRQEAPRRAGVSSFGIGGSNVHVIVEEAPVAGPNGPSRPMHLLALSAKTPPALAMNAQRLAGYLQRHPGTDLGDVACTLMRRRAFEYRQAVVCKERDDALTAIRKLERLPAVKAAGHEAPVAFLFPGQGAQYAGMARDLYDHEPVFAEEFDRCAKLFAGHLGEDLRTLLFAPHGDAEAVAQKLEQTAITQPAIFTVEYALAALWRAWGVRPRAMAGHSIGEYVAACLAGVFSLADAVALVAARGRLVQAMPRGAMLAVMLPEQETMAWLGGGVCLAAVNSTALSVVSGPAKAVDDLRQRLAAAGIACRRLHTSHAFHSASMDGAVGPLVEEFRKVQLNAPRIPFCSNVTGTWITDEQATSPEYWGTHLRQPVRFRDALDELLTDPALLMVEVGPGETLSSFARQHQAWDDGRTAASTLRHPNDKRDDREYLLQSLGALWSAGAPVDWTGLYQGENRRPLPLPGYAFQHVRYWLDADADTGGRQPHLPAGSAAPAGDWFYTPGWKRLPLQGEEDGTAADAVWAVLGADLRLGRDLAQHLEAENATVVRVTAGGEFRRGGDRSWSLDPANREHCARLIEFLTAAGPQKIRIVHLWSLGCDPAGRLDEPRLDSARRLGFDSLLALAQGIGDMRPPGPITIDVVCRGLYEVTGDEQLQPENATLLGASMVIPQEIEGATCRTLDITGTDPRKPRAGAVRALRAILGRPTGEADLALRGQHWWARDFDAVRFGSGANGGARLRAGGVYLITGGLGGVGLALAEHIARSVDSPVLGLLSRSAFPAEPAWAGWQASHDERDVTSTRIRRLVRLQEAGARVVVLQADVTDLEQTTRACDELRSRFGAINGVIHAAGVPSQGLIMGKSRADVDRVLAAKTRGTLVLDRVCDGGDCDFVLLCSSLASVLGGPGQSDYGAGNAFLDVFAQWKRRESGAPVSAVAWDTWRDVGMAAGLAARLRGGPGPVGEPTGHPLLQRLVQATERSQTYATTFSTADSWIVDEHRIMGHGLVPGTAYLELARAAAARQAHGRVIELHDVLFTMPLIVPDGQTRDVYTTVEQRDGQIRFTVRSQGPVAGTATVWQEHASGAVSLHGKNAEVVRDLGEVRRRCGGTEVIETEDDLKHRLKLDLVEQGPIQFSFGPRWRRSLRRIQVGDTRLLVMLKLDDAFLSDLDSYWLHPALLDLAGAAARIHAPDIYYMPFTYGSVHVSSGLTSTIYCDVELKESGDSSGETLTCDIEILDPKGRSLVRVAGLTIKRISDVDGMLHRIERSAAAQPPDAGAAGQPPAGSMLRALSEGMSEQDGVGAFARILAAPSVPAQLVVSSKDLAAMRRLARSITPSVLAHEIEQIPQSGGTHPRPDLATPYVAPATDAEERIAAIWQEVLGIDRIGVDDDFFALGGHSLAAVQIGAKIQRQFAVELDLRDFFAGPTVASTVALLTAAGRRDEAAQDGIAALRRDELDDDALKDLDELSDEEVDAKLRELLAAEVKEQGSQA
jgi:acyl transferase domain-containing protein/acyl carrier protein